MTVRRNSKNPFHDSFCRGMMLAAFITLSSQLSSLQAQDVQTGKASFYSMKFTGRQTASGERLHHDSLTCAHRTYPFGTLLKVTNPANDKSVIVRVTDRGPYVKGRIIDLSRRAAREIGIIAQGIAPVVVERVNPSIVPPFKPEDVFELPELELSTSESSITKPIWEELKEKQEQKNQNQENTHIVTRKFPPPPEKNVEPTKEVKTQEMKSLSPKVTPPQGNKSGLDEINKAPNRSKAYQKREQAPTKASKR